MKLNQIFTSHMVFQANKPIRIFGEGKGRISVEFAGNIFEKTVDTDKWLLELSAMDYGGPYDMKILLDGEEKLLSDIYIGDVYLLAGQSNIEFSLEGTNFPEELYEDCPLVRAYMQDRLTLSPNIRSEDGWMVCGNTDKLKFWSAIGYHMALKISKQKDIAVGLVFCYKGASVIESWLPKEITSKPEYRIPFEQRYLSKSTEKGSPHNVDGALYEATQQKIVPFSFSAVIWYQGESNTGDGDYKIYAGLLKELIIIWRKDFIDEQLPFVIVQIADYDARNDYAWKKIQDIQISIADEVENVITVKSADICESFDIHPPTKTSLAGRIADIFLIE